MLKHLTQIFVYLLLVIGFSTPTSASDERSIYFFYGDGCPHCAVVEEYFAAEKIYERYPIKKKEIYFERENAILFQEMMKQRQIPQERQGVPTVIIGNSVLIGQSEIEQRFRTLADEYIAGNQIEADLPTSTQKTQPAELTAIAVIGGALVDAINPCAFAVLILLMTTILAGNNRKTALYSGLTFSTAIFISYFLMGLGVYKALGTGTVGHLFYRVVGWLAILLGLLNFKDYLWYGKGILMEVPLSWRPRLKKLISTVTNPAGAFFVGFLVSLFLLPCTSGPYIVILGMLAKNTQFLRALGYLLLYNLIFIAPMIMITLAVYKGYSLKRAESIRQHHLRTLHLIAGALLVAIGIAIVLGLF